MISKSFRRTLKLYQAGVARLTVEFRQKLLLQGGVLACQRGCIHCCYQPLTMTILDGILVYQWLAKNHLWTRRLKESFEETAERTTNLALEVWLLGMIPCPLLDEEEKVCRAYKGRPFICRIAFSYDAYHCHPHRFIEMLKEVPRSLLRQETMQAEMELETKLLKRHRFPRLVLPFAAAVLHGEAICTTDDYLDQAKLIWLKELRGD